MSVPDSFPRLTVLLFSEEIHIAGNPAALKGLLWLIQEALNDESTVRDFSGQVQYRDLHTNRQLTVSVLNFSVFEKLPECHHCQGKGRVFSRIFPSAQCEECGGCGRRVPKGCKRVVVLI